MGSSQAKKIAKKADFQKVKLKVGKDRPKATNGTDTSFRSKGIVLKDQSLAADLLSTSTRVTTYLAHLESRSEHQRKESLAALTNASMRHGIDGSVVMEKALPLMTDGSPAVRDQLLRLLRSLDPSQCRGYENRVILYIQSGLTNIATGICRSALEFLIWAAETYGKTLFSCQGGWYRLLDCFVLILGWHIPRVQEGRMENGLGRGQAVERFTKEPKLVIKAIETLATFISLGLAAGDTSQQHERLDRIDILPHLIPRLSGPFTRLNLFDAPSDIGDQIFDDTESRRTVLAESFRPAIERGIRDAKCQGGEHGRAAGSLQKAINLC